MVKPTHLVVAGTLARHQVALDVRGSLKNEKQKKYTVLSQIRKNKFQI